MTSQDNQIMVESASEKKNMGQFLYQLDPEVRKKDHSRKYYQKQELKCILSCSTKHT